MNKITPKPGIMDIEVYIGGESRIDGKDNVIKLSSNENPHGCSPMAREAFLSVAGALAAYPSSDHSGLKTALAGHYGVDAGNLICGNGSDELIGLLCAAFAGVGDEVLFSHHGFLMYRLAALAVGATPVSATEQNRTTDVEALLAACTDKTRLVFIANPNNPTGTMIDTEAMERLADGIPSGAILVIDGAYAEFVRGYDGGQNLAQTRDNVVMLRTFSKLYGLASLRLGWGVASREIIEVLSRLRGPFNVNSAALSAGVAALNDAEHRDYCLAENEKLRDWMTRECHTLGLQVDESTANFILVRFDDAGQAGRADDYLKQNGIIVRHVAAYDLADCLRITVGTGAQSARLMVAIKGFIAKEKQ